MTIIGFVGCFFQGVTPPLLLLPDLKTAQLQCRPLPPQDTSLS